MIRKLYPNGKLKAFNVTYDDGVLQDIRFVSLLNQYRLKGTFNLNSQLMEDEFEWMHENGCTVKRISKDKVVSLYKECEIASHTLTHPYMDSLSETEIMHELQTDKANLEKLFDKEIKGFAVPFDYYSDLIEKCVKKCGFEYARISEESHSFTPQKDYYRWKATVFHTDSALKELAQQFINTNEELALFQIAGHSYDLDIENMWETIEGVFKAISTQNDILPMTTIEIIEYLKAMDKVEITDKYIKNNSNISLWFSVDNTAFEVKPNETFFEVNMDYTIRKMQSYEYPLLDDFLYQAIYQPDKSNLAPKSIINKPELQIYIKDFGTKKDDYCLCAEVENKVVGAVWVRNINGYGNVDDNTVEFAISVFDEYQKMGIGTALMKKMLEHLTELNYQKASLAVQKENYAVRMYQKVGFEIACENEQEYIMIHRLQN